jgi:hypothetical protein
MAARTRPLFIAALPKQVIDPRGTIYQQTIRCSMWNCA